MIPLPPSSVYMYHIWKLTNPQNKTEQERHSSDDQEYYEELDIDIMLLTFLSLAIIVGSSTAQEWVPFSQLIFSASDSIWEFDLQYCQCTPHPTDPLRRWPSDRKGLRLPELDWEESKRNHLVPSPQVSKVFPGPYSIYFINFVISFQGEDCRE